MVGRQVTVQEREEALALAKRMVKPDGTGPSRTAFERATGIPSSRCGPVWSEVLSQIGATKIGIRGRGGKNGRNHLSHLRAEQITTIPALLTAFMQNRTEIVATYERLQALGMSEPQAWRLVNQQLRAWGLPLMNQLSSPELRTGWEQPMGYEAAPLWDGV